MIQKSIRECLAIAPQSGNIDHHEHSTGWFVNDEAIYFMKRVTKHIPSCSHRLFHRHDIGRTIPQGKRGCVLCELADAKQQTL